MPATAGNRLSLQVGQPPGTARDATVPLVTASTDINRAFYRGPSERERHKGQMAVRSAGSGLLTVGTLGESTGAWPVCYPGHVQSGLLTYWRTC